MHKKLEKARVEKTEIVERERRKEKRGKTRLASRHCCCPRRRGSIVERVELATTTKGVDEDDK